MGKLREEENETRSKRKKKRTRTRNREASGDGRAARLQELIREEVNFLLRNEARDPRLDGVEITMVELTGDGSCARLWFTTASEEARMEALNRAAGFMRNHLAESLGLKRIPELRFRRDPATRVFAPDGQERE
jgi:ribosome-binding factor A